MVQAAKAMEPKKHAKCVRVPRKVLAFQQVAARGEERLIEWFVKREGVGVDSRDRNGNTAFIKAAENGENGSMVKLLGLGSDPNAANKFGQTALMLAAANGHLSTVRILLGSRAKAYLTDNEGKRASGYALENGHLEVAVNIERSLEVLNKGAKEAKKAIEAGERRRGELDYYLCKGADPDSLDA